MSEQTPRDDLVERLRRREFIAPHADAPLPVNPDGPEAADRIERLERALGDCSDYLKPGETPAERMARDQKDVLALMRLLQREKERVETLKAALADAVRWNIENARLRDKYAHELAALKGQEG